MSTKLIGYQKIKSTEQVENQNDLCEATILTRPPIADGGTQPVDKWVNQRRPRRLRSVRFPRGIRKGENPFCPRSLQEIERGTPSSPKLNATPNATSELEQKTSEQRSPISPVFTIDFLAIQFSQTVAFRHKIHLIAEADFVVVQA